MCLTTSVWPTSNYKLQSIRVEIYNVVSKDCRGRRLSTEDEPLPLKNNLRASPFLSWVCNSFMQVTSNLCTPKNGDILVAATQDFLTSAFMISHKDSFYDRAAFALLCGYMGDAKEEIDLPTPALLKVG